MANAVITSASGSLGSSGVGSIMTVLADEFLAVKRNRGSIIPFCNTKADGVGSPHGTVRFLVPPSGATVSDENDGTAPDYDDAIATSKDVVLNTHKSLKIGFSQIAQTLDGGRSIAPIVAGRMADLLNSVDATVAALGSTASAHVGSAATNLDESIFDAARATLVANKAPKENFYAAFYPCATSFTALSNLGIAKEFQIRGLPSPGATEDGTAYGAKPLNIKGVGCFESTNVKQVAAGSPSVTTTYNFMWHSDAILVAMKAPVAPQSSGVEVMNFVDSDSNIEWQIMKYFDKDSGSDVLKLHAFFSAALGRTDWIVGMYA